MYAFSAAKLLFSHRHLQLRKIVFGIYLDPNRPNVRTPFDRRSFLFDLTRKDVEEVYDFRFSYPSHAAPSMTVTHGGATVASASGGSKKEVRKSVQQLLRTLITLVQTLKVRLALG